MAKLNFKISPETIRRANNNLILKGIDNHVRENYTGVITTKTIVGGSIKIREISKKEINDAYAKALKQYAQKL